MTVARRSSEAVVLFDIGSTYTKALAVDLEAERVVAAARAPTTVETDVTIGLRKALEQLESRAGNLGDATMLACSSAAGGLRMVSVGLVPEMSSEAAKRAALGAGAKIVGHYSHRLNTREIEAIVSLRPDIILLAGGTDGGNENTIIHNARMLAAAPLAAPIVVAGNKCAYGEIEPLLSAAGKIFHLIDNVMPEIGRLEVEACRNTIRDVFLGNIVKAKGLDNAKRLVRDIVMPTPVAVLFAATLLSEGLPDEPGLGELIVIDVGGATTDVYSIAKGAPVRGAVGIRGLPEPFAKRTVEGDLGVRYNIETLAAICRQRGQAMDDDLLASFLAEPSRLPKTAPEYALDAELARAAVATSFERHVGRVETVYGPHGEMLVQTGKDLSAVRTVVGTGGPLINGRMPHLALGGVLAGEGDPALLKPERASLYIDQDYILFAMGLLAQRAPRVALRLMKKGLTEIETTDDARTGLTGRSLKL